MKAADKPIPNGETLRQAAQKILAVRKLRSSFLPREMFGEPAWEILLRLYSARDAAGHSAQQLEANLEAPASTTRRWLRYLEHEGFITRGVGDHRARDEVELTQKARHALDVVLQEF